MHPAKHIFGIKSSLLLDKKIILGITGSIAAEESVKLARELIRHGAEVHAVMSEEAKKIISKEALTFATGNTVIDRITGNVEHVSLLRDADLYLIAPCSANTISKLAHGIADTTVSLFGVNALGSVKILIASAMHEQMYANPILQNNIELLKKHNVEFIPPKFEEAKVKMADIDTITAYTIHTLNQDLKNKNVLVIGGGSVEYIDDVRVITNISTSNTAIALAKNAFYLGANVTLLLGPFGKNAPAYIQTDQFTTVNSLIAKIPEIIHYDYILVPAALSDFTIKKRSGKISSTEKIAIELVPNPKFIRKLREHYKNILVGFKAEYGVTQTELFNKALEHLNSEHLDFIVANDLKDVTANYTKVLLLAHDLNVPISGTKDDVMLQILRIIALTTSV